MAKIFPIPAFNDNYIWLITDDAANKAVVVDPGDATPVEEYLREQHLQLCGILITHHHFDHVGGVAALTLHRDIPVYGPAGESIPNISQALNDRDIVNLADLELTLEVIDVPGHTAGHIAYYCEQPKPILFCGDTLFSGGCGRLFEGSPQQMHHSLSKLNNLPESTEIYCTHEYTQANLGFALAVEPNNSDLVQYAEEVENLRAQGKPSLPSTLALERKINPFLRSHVASVKTNLEEHTRSSLATEVEVFRATREWKDNF